MQDPRSSLARVLARMIREFDRADAAHRFLRPKLTYAIPMWSPSA